MITGMDLVMTARAYLKVPYLDKGRSKERGVDCVGLVIAAAKERGLSMADNHSYSAVPNPKTLLDGLLSNCEQTLKKEYLPGMIGLVQFHKDVGPTHIVLFTEEGILHSHNRGQKMVIEHPFSESWKRRVVATFKINGVQYE